ncbi:hypothetical protein [Corallococcus sp. CA053C]|uniref:hypothetical protein n=1 Tax=Corallococcus sp. CA053C TaxID=2316732 RepID=UPI0011C35854|nr:hypothetical protein [Corallococcus sp. CA053C]
MKNRKRALLELIEQALDFLDSITDEELSHLQKGTHRLSIGIEKTTRAETREKPTHSRGRSNTPWVQNDLDFKAVTSRLRSFQSREEGAALLVDRYPTKSLLQGLARHLDVHVAKEDDVEMIRNKIIETTIGYRLRSSAVRGTSIDDH